MQARRLHSISLRNPWIELPLFVVLCVLFSACRFVDPHDPSDIALRVGNDRYFAGASATLTIRNNSGRTILYNLCNAELDRQDDGEWVRVELDSRCPDSLDALGHSREATQEYNLDPTLPAGTYRFVYTFAPTGDDEELTLMTNRFDIDQL